MKIALIALWILSLGAAYLIGRIIASPPGVSVEIIEAPVSAPPSSSPAAPPLEAPPWSIPETGLELVSPPETVAVPTAPPPRFTGSPASIFRKALDTDNPIQRLAALSHVLENLGPHNVEAVLSVFKERPHDWESMRELSHVLYAWAEFDGPAAMDYTQERFKDPGMKQRAAYSVLSAWAGEDPEAAVDWAKENFDGKENPYYVGLINGVAKKDLGRATELILELPYGGVRGKAANLLIDQHLKNIGEKETMDWASTIPDERLQQGLVRMTANKVAREFPAYTAEWLLKTANAETMKHTLGDVVGIWSQEDPEAAMAWSLDVEDKNYRGQSIRGAMGQWARRDVQAAGEWLKEVEASPERDEAIKAYAGGIIRRDPEGALVWAAEISDETDRHRTLERVAAEVIRRNPEKADALGLRGEAP